MSYRIKYINPYGTLAYKRIPIISDRRPDLIVMNRKMRTYKIVDFAVAAYHRIKQKEREIKDKYLQLAWELKNLRNMKVTIISIVIGSFGTVTKRSLKG